MNYPVDIALYSSILIYKILVAIILISCILLIILPYFGRKKLKLNATWPR